MDVAERRPLALVDNGRESASQVDPQPADDVRMERRTGDFVEKKGDVDPVKSFGDVQSDDCSAAVRFLMLVSVGDLRDERKKSGDGGTFSTESMLVVGGTKGVVQ